jgi:hypothetical protein
MLNKVAVLITLQRLSKPLNHNGLNFAKVYDVFSHKEQT